MIRSMTGYGAAASMVEDSSVSVEIRSVNSRGLKVVVRGPAGSDAWESELREVVETAVQRGRVDVLIRVETETGLESGATLDEARVRALLAGLEQLRTRFGIGGEADVATLAGLGGLFRDRPVGALADVPLETVKSVLSEALSGLVEMRVLEGGRLAIDLGERIAGLRAGLHASEALAPERLSRERTRLREAVLELTGRELDEDRVAREIAMIADKWDVGEELVRARSHLDAFDEYLGRPEAEPVGKRLGFLVQELQREINTLGAKANDTRISRHVVEMKNEIEKLREQVENVE
jgi:uncharacterized protein (TIGR00255 family)